VITPGEPLDVSRAKHGTAVDGQVRLEIDVKVPGTVSFFHVDALVPDTHNEPAVVLQ